MRKRTKILILILCGVCALIAASFIPYFAARIRTGDFLAENEDTNIKALIDEEMESAKWTDFAVLEYDDTSVTVYYYTTAQVNGYKSADVFDYEKQNGEWVFTRWDKMWSTGGDGENRYTAAYWWHFFIAPPS